MSQGGARLSLNSGMIIPDIAGDISYFRASSFAELALSAGTTRTARETDIVAAATWYCHNRIVGSARLLRRGAGQRRPRAGCLIKPDKIGITGISKEERHRSCCGRL